MARRSAALIERCGWVTASMLAAAVVSLAGYGLTVGVFSGGAQLWAAPAKIVLGARLTIVICFPSLAIFSCLAGVDTRPGLIVGGLVALVALYSVLLVGFAPVSWVFSQATDSVVFMGVIHLVFWSIDLYYGMRFLFRAFGYGNGRKHLVLWAVVFVIVSLQMTTCLRPIIGSSDTFFTSEKKFFVEHWVETIEPGLPD